MQRIPATVSRGPGCPTPAAGPRQSRSYRSGLRWAHADTREPRVAERGRSRCHALR
ncbi:hypothetical protein ACFFX0_09960 [Citricoccus parietis]|uniref:Uncharacterized protein n=1 Tax=Citricoccus parietis TaxID=592307 RepID=A0ABV5FYL8_9MICC